MEFKFTLNDLQKLKLTINKEWFYRNCRPDSTRLGSKSIENEYTTVSIQKTIQRKRNELKKNYPENNKKRQNAEAKLCAIEQAVEKLSQYRFSYSDSSKQH